MFLKNLMVHIQRKTAKCKVLSYGNFSLWNAISEEGIGYRLGLSTQPGNPTNPSKPEFEPETAQTDHPNSIWWVATHRTQHLRVDWWVSSPKTWATWADHKTKKFRQYLKVFQLKLTKTSNIWSSSMKNYLKLIIFDEISSRFSPDPTRSHWDPMRSHRDLARSWWIWPK